MERSPAERAHLAGFDATKLPRFKWREYPVSEKPRITFQTEMGEIEAELYTGQAPHAVTNLLRYLRDGYFRNGQFFRALTSENQPPNSPLMQAVELRADPQKAGELFPPIPAETTNCLKHLDGTLTISRERGEAVQDHFFICIGDQLDLDAGGKRNPDGKIFTPFGRVTRNMDLVRKIQALPAEKQTLTPPLRIQGAYRLE
jgi:peptidyl-prolyl cis-trans isomerase A (cyclophilin A)